MNHYRTIGKLLAVVVLLLAGLNAFAQTADPKNAVGAAEKAAVVEKIVELLNKNYVFPETARQLEAMLREKMRKNEYQKITDGPEFALRLTNDLQAVSNDRHLRVGYSPNVLPPDEGDLFNPPKDEIERIRREQARANFGVARVEILRGNIGLIRFDYFTNPDWAGEVYTAAMNYVARTDALIIDLRYNGGSMHPDAIPFLCSYFFDKSVHLNDIYWRPTDETHQFWTYAQVPGRRYADKPIYVLTSRRTFSGGEEITYDLKNLKRAVIVGETTGGGANGGGDRRAGDHFTIFVPIGRAISPVTKTNWEGTGVAPDVEVVSGKALYTAQLAALAEIRKKAALDDDRQWLDAVRTETEGKLKSFKKQTFRLKGFAAAQEVNLAGDFNGWSRRSLKMTRTTDGWTLDVELEPGRTEYKFVVDGRWIADPENPETAGPNGNSVIWTN
ncbi:MAG: peptidase [Acidobacteria bacterium]|nr:peptidase [Acidobacteriota bacterium]